MDKMTESSGANKAATTKARKGTWLDTLQMNPKQYWPKKYRYTVEPFPGTTAALSVKERDHYEENGFIVVKNLFPKLAMDSLKKILADPTRLEEALTQYSQDPNVLRYVECFCGSNVMALLRAQFQQTPPQSSTEVETLMTAFLIKETSNAGSSVKSLIKPQQLFRDLFSFPFRPADRIVCGWTVLDEGASSGNPSAAAPISSSFLLVPGSHKSSVMKTIEGDQTMIYEQLPPQESLVQQTPKQLSLNLGDTIFYHPLLLHGFSSGSTQAFSCHFAPTDCEFVSTSGHESWIPSHLSQISSAASDSNPSAWRNQTVLVKGQTSKL